MSELELIVIELKRLVEHQTKPSTVLKPKLCKIKDRWIAFYGGSSAHDLWAAGRSPEEAMLEFDKEYYRMIQDESNG